MNKFLVVGLGNILLRDEGVGVRAVEALRQNFEFSEQLTLLDGGTLGLDLLPYLEGMDKILFVDAVDLKKKPGNIAILEDGEIPSSLSGAISFHQIGLADLLFSARFMGMNPSKVVLIGIQPQEIDTGLTLSQTIRENFETLLGKIVSRLSEWGVEVREKTPGEHTHVPGHPF